MRVGPRSSLATVAVAVGDASGRHDIQAVLTGGACASLYTRGSYQSRDMDFIVAGAVTQPSLDRAMASRGFHRSGDATLRAGVVRRRVSSRPAATVIDYQIEPVTRSTTAGRALVLSATDSCRDRLAAFYHWNDRQSLDVAVSIARRNRIDLARVQRWSAREEFTARSVEFRTELARRHQRRAR